MTWNETPLVFNGFLRLQKHPPVPRYSNMSRSWPCATPGETWPFLPFYPPSFLTSGSRCLCDTHCSKKPTQLGWVNVWTLYLKEKEHKCHFWFTSLAHEVWERVDFFSASLKCSHLHQVFEWWHLEVKYPDEWWQGYLIFNCFNM